ncbi:site-specific integrase [Arenimonas sp. MALMAid1274]|uniref:site-specific integrase n=1 Tax=Arenimonas sp. MALMAid1274 TaxID=3411630 RepID=UPI003B9EF001
MAITVRALETLAPGRWLSEAGNRNEGALRAKGGPHGARFYFRYRNSGGTYDDLPLGKFDAKGRDGMTLVAARARSGELVRRYRAGESDLRLAIETERREGERELAAKVKALAESEARRAACLGVLLGAYVKQLERDGKASAGAVLRALERHVRDPWPKLWATPADDVAMDDLLAVIARVSDAGKLTEARKLRAYLLAAYKAAVRARQDARGHPALRELRISSNPARDLAAIDGGAGARERALSLAELRAYWRRVNELPDPAGALLRFHLVTGAQRVEQLARLQVADIDLDGGTMRLRDGKGRRKSPRLHDVPLLPEALASIRAMAPQRTGAFVFTVTAGRSGAAYSTVLHRVREIVAAMGEAGELEKGAFTVGDLRRTVETRLAAEGVSTEIRAQLQSHGLGGVQARHYDRHDYLVEKKSALKTLLRLMEGNAATVTPIRKRRT